MAHRHGTTVTTAAGIFQLSVSPAQRLDWEAAVAEGQAAAGVLKLRGLPTRASPADVLAFFEVGGCGGVQGVGKLSGLPMQWVAADALAFFLLGGWVGG